MILDINYFTTLIPICLAIIAAFTYFFGKTIGDTQIKNYDKHMYYLEGGNFILSQILIPYLFIHAIVTSFELYKNFNFFNINGLYLVLLLVLITLQGTFLDYITSKAFKVNETNCPLILFGKKYSEIKSIVLLMTAGLNYVILYISYYLVVNDPNFEPLLAVLVVIAISIAFFTYILLAMIHGISSTKDLYITARIVLKNEQTVSGDIISFGEYITLVKGDKVYDINKDEICFIEKSIDYLREASLEERNDQKDQCKLITE